MIWHLAQFNHARLQKPIDDPASSGFVDGLDAMNALAEAAPGFVWRLADESGNATGIETAGDPMRIINISVWESAKALQDYAYRSAHVEYMRQRLDWFEPRDGAHLVLWWVPACHQPTLDEADDRLAQLVADGPSAAAFTFLPTFPCPTHEPEQ